jgi:hypothetical protein
MVAARSTRKETMVYTDLEALCEALWQADKNDTDGVRELGRLTKVYWDAYHNPPEGVIGVGAITYAQEALIAAQLNEGA